MRKEMSTDKVVISMITMNSLTRLNDIFIKILDSILKILYSSIILVDGSNYETVSSAREWCDKHSKEL